LVCGITELASETSFSASAEGFARLIESFANLHRRYGDWKLKIVGDGVEQENLERLIGEYSLEDSVILTGQLDADGVQREMRDASIYAMTSYSEGFALVLIEAFSCSLPCVAYDVRVGPAAIIENGLSGLLVPDGDSEEFERCMAELIENEELRKSMGQAAYERVRCFSAEEVSKIWFDVLSGGELA